MPGFTSAIHRFRGAYSIPLLTSAGLAEAQSTMSDEIKDEPSSPEANADGDIDEKAKLEEDESSPIAGDPIIPKGEDDDQGEDVDKDAKELKLDTLRATCDAKERDEIAAQALSKHGLVNDEMRKRAWPILLGYDPSVIKTELEDAKVKLENDKVILQDYLGRVPYTELPPHRDEEQVALDVNRSFVYYPSGKLGEHAWRFFTGGSLLICRR